MNSTQKNTLTFVAVIVLIGATVFYLNRINTDATLPGLASNNNEVVAVYAEIPELGIRMQLPEEIKDLSYVVAENKKTVMFSSASLKSLDYANGGSHCTEANGPLGYISNDDSFFTARNVTPAESDQVHNIGDTWVYYIHPQETCSQTKTVQDLQGTQITALQEAFKNAQPASSASTVQ